MNAFLFVLFFMVVLLAFAEERMTVRQKQGVLIGLGIVMIFLAATKDINVVTDADAYEKLFYLNDDPLVEVMTEPTYIHISRIIIALGGSFAVIFLVYAIISIPLKLAILNKMTPYVFTAMLIYIPVYYELHELVQIRAGAAGAFLLCSLYFFSNKRYWLCTAAFLVAVSFHYSSFTFVPLFFMGTKRIGVVGRWLLACIVPIGFAMYFLGLDLFMILPSSLIGGKVDFYKSSTEAVGEEIMLVYKNPFFVLKCILFLVMLRFYDYVEEKCKYFTIALKAQACSIFMMLSVSTVPTLAGRTSELFGIMDPILFASIVYLVKPRYAARIIITCIGLLMMVYNLMLAHYFDEA